MTYYFVWQKNIKFQFHDNKNLEIDTILQLNLKIIKIGLKNKIKKQKKNIIQMVYKNI